MISIKQNDKIRNLKKVFDEMVTKHNFAFAIFETFEGGLS
jgi:hypothetical protein